MKIDNVKLVVSLTASAVVTGISVAQYIRVHRQEVAKREEIQNNLVLDLQAIRNASVCTQMRLDNGLYDNKPLDKIMEDLNTEIEFQKIVIREK